MLTKLAARKRFAKLAAAAAVLRKRAVDLSGVSDRELLQQLRDNGESYYARTGAGIMAGSGAGAAAGGIAGGVPGAVLGTLVGGGVGGIGAAASAPNLPAARAIVRELHRRRRQRAALRGDIPQREGLIRDEEEGLRELV